MNRPNKKKHHAGRMANAKDLKLYKKWKRTGAIPT
jgi:hypothetical protein